MIPFNSPPFTGYEDEYVLDAMRSSKQSGDGPYGHKCQQWFEQRLGCVKALMTPSCTHALEMAAILIDVQPGDEIIMPSYTFVSTANPFVLRGAKVIFVDVRPDTMNINEQLIEAAITERTKAIVPVHYAGVSCDMDIIMDIANRHQLYVVEDAAQAFDSFYKREPVGTRGHLAAFSFHETKNITSGGEGGLLVINDQRFVHRAEIIREKGTNRSQFFRGMVDKYTWVDVGSSYLPSELQSAYLYGQLVAAEKISTRRMAIWQNYFEAFRSLQHDGVIELPVVPDECQHNAHMFFFKVKNIDVRSALLDYLKQNGVYAVFHYVPLHSAPAGREHGIMFGEDRYTTKDSERLVRLPLFYNMEPAQQEQVVNKVKAFFSET